MSEYAGVYLLDNPYFLDDTFDYFIPPDLRCNICKGDFVTVPFGTANRRCLGIVSSLKDSPDDPNLSCKPVLSVCDKSMSLSEEMFGLCFFMKERTLCTMGDAIRAAIPASALSHLEEVYRPSGNTQNTNTLDSATTFIFEHIKAKGCLSHDVLKTKFGPSLDGALKKLLLEGFIEKDFVIRASSEKSETVYELLLKDDDVLALLEGKEASVKLRSPQQLAIIKALYESEAEALTEKELCERAKTTTSPIKTLCDKGVLKKTRRLIDRSFLPEFQNVSKAEIVLNDEQNAAYETICSLSDSGEPKAALLHGVTGSGKTSVMLCAIDHVLESGRGVIVLLPEIALTPQSLAIFCSRYGKKVAIIHSGLSAGERFDTYKRIKRGDASVVIGTRSAIFAPLKDLGMIIIDEEQEHTYKSDMNPKYHARDIARYRCAWHKGLMLLASATPSFESYSRAREGAYTLIEINKRYGKAVLPATTVVDMRRESAEGSTSPLSSLLCKRLVENHKNGNQSILFLNRRGYNNFISCRTCGKPIQCPKCSVSMAYHTFGNSYDKGELRCHWCGLRTPLPEVCPECNSAHLSKMGYGTQRIEQELSELLPSARILRMDADTTTSRYSYENILGKFRRHEADILLGTQMVTKGHDFPDVTLVGVLLADTSLYLDDYRAGERTFSMLTQVIGRAGRGNKIGEAIIQTSNPDHECIRLSCAQDYKSFYENEIRLRRALQFPPFCDIALLTITSPEEKELLKASTMLRNEFLRLHKEKYPELPIDSFGPFEAPVYRVENRYRMRMVIKCRLNKRSRALFSELLSGFSRVSIRNLTLSIDFNPSNL
jgi:primosomal protein N' (replication factor Y)